MAKYNSREAFNSRICELAQTKKSNLKEVRNIGTLIDFKRDIDGIAYGIIKENHHYYIKKGSKKEDLDAADFSFIGGLENIKSYQYNSISEAEKKRNTMFAFINESHHITSNKTTTKLIKENANDEIEAAEDSVDDLDDATAAKKEMQQNPVVPDLGDNDPIPNDMGGLSPDSEPEGDLGSGEPAGAGGEPEGEPEGEDMGDDMGGEPEGEFSDDNKELQKLTGKYAEKLRKSKLDVPEIKSVVNSVLSALKDKLPEVEIEDRKEMANKLLKVVDQGEIDDLENSMPADNVDEEQTCDECGSFTQFAESRGYDKDSFANASPEEKTSVISGYVNAHNDGKNDGDAKSVALYADDDIAEALDKEYGHNKYVSEILKPEMMKMSESTDEDKELKINELSWGGLKNAASAVGGGLKNIANTAGTGLKNAYNATVDKTKEVGGNIAKQYNTGVRDDRVNQVNKLAQEFKAKIDALNASSAKIGGKQIDINQALDLVKKQLAGTPSNIQGNKGATAAYNLGRNNTIKGAVTENPVDAGNTEVREMLREDDDDVNVDDLDLNDTDTDDNTEEVNTTEFAPEQSLGVMGSANGGSMDVNVDGNNKSVNIKLNENKISNGHVLAKKASIATKPTSMEKSPVNTKGIEKVAKKTEGHVLAKKASIATKPTSMETQSTNNKAFEKVAKKTEGHVLAKKASIATKPVKTEMIHEEDEPSAGLTKKEKSNIVKKAKSGADIGKKGKGFEKVANKAAKEYGSKKAGEKVAAAAMWKNAAKNESVEISESEQKLRTYIRNRLEEKTGKRKVSLNESKKSDKMKLLDKLIDEQYLRFNKK